MRRQVLALLLVVGTVLAGCGEGPGPTLSRTGPEPALHAPTSTASTTPSLPAPPATTVPPSPLPAAPTDGDVRALATPSGVVVPVLGAAPGGGFRVGTPCGGQAVVSGGTPMHGATVVLDPGHGGVEPGAVGENGLTEKALNLAVAEATKAALEREGATVVLTRTADYRVTLAARAALVQALRPPVFISIHHNGGHDGPSDKPGTETFFQVASPDSRRLAGILYEELLATFSAYEATTWFSDLDAGAKYRTNSGGGDYYGILRLTNGVTSVLSEALFLSSSLAEAELLARPDVQVAEAEAITRAVRRFMIGNDPGSGFIEPYPRDEPAGSGGGATNCVDPPLG